jgi:hypothetical protein
LTLLRATVLDRLVRRRRGASGSVEDILCLNLSWVLHERSSSHAVRSTAQAALRHAEATTHLTRTLTIEVIDASPTNEIDLVLTAWVGLPRHLPGALTHVHGAMDAPIVVVDADGEPTEVDFFRGRARLVLPDHRSRTVAVAGLILRPGGRTAHLRVLDVRRWPEETDAVLRALEQLIQPHTDQWLPPRPLWDVPAESGLGDEVR